VTANEQELVELISVRQPRCRIRRAALAAQGADAAPTTEGRLPKRRESRTTSSPDARSAQAGRL